MDAETQAGLNMNFYYPNSQYIPPHQFYYRHGAFPDVPSGYMGGRVQDPGASATESLPVLPTPVDSRSPSPPPGAKHPRSPSPASPPAKRPRGRPPGKKSNTGSVPKASQTRAKPAAKAKTQNPKTNSANNKENEPIEIDDSDSELENSGRKVWSDTEKTSVFNFIMGPDAEGDRRFEQHKKNPGHVYKRASENLLNGSRSAKSIKALWQRSSETYTWIVAFESFTGNGGGDPDSDSPTGIVRKKLEGARKAGLAIGTLKPEIITAWERNGWFKLFTDRLGASAKISREVVRNSAAPLSDSEEIDDEASGNEARTASKPPKTEAAVVSEFKHTPSSKFRVQVTNSLGNMGELVKMKMLTEEKKSKAMDRKLDLDQARFELERKKAETEEQKVKLEMARSVLAMEGTDAAARDAANTYIRSVFLM